DDPDRLGVWRSVGLRVRSEPVEAGRQCHGTVVRAGEEFGGKWLEIVKATLPKAARVGIILNPANRSSAESIGDMESVAPSLGLQLISRAVKDSLDIDAAFHALTRAHVAAVIIMTDPLVVGETTHIVNVAAIRGVPAVYGLREFVDAGGL